MRETVIWDPKPTAVVLAAEIIAELEAVRRSISHRSLIVWGEHCSECAFPTCYSSCSFYAPRPDNLNCRRFERGLEALTLASHSPEFGLMRIRPRQWAKLQGSGPTAFYSSSPAKLLQISDTLVSATVTNAPLPYMRRQKAVWGWNDRKSKFGRKDRLPASDVFMIECILVDSGSPVAMTLTVVPADKGQPGLYQCGFSFRPGYARVEVPTREIARSVDLTRPFFVQIEPVEAAVGRDLIFGMVDFVSFHARLRLSAPAPSLAKSIKRAKCVVWDLDNTVWNGTLVEDGLDGLTIRPEVVRAIMALDQRGILQSVASKNDPEAAIAAIEIAGLKDLFLYPQIGWGRKSDSVRRVAELLDIGLDTLVFIDDQEFERAEVCETLKVVTVLKDTEVDGLLDNPLFDVPVTKESIGRRLMYRDEEVRRATFLSTPGGDYVNFLRSCNITLDVRRLKKDDVDRIYELSQRTNQLNVSGSRYERDQVAGMLTDHSRFGLVLRCADRFGDYGIIGFASIVPERSEVEDFFMSCRVQRKRVEHALFQHLSDILRAQGAQSIRVRFRNTKRNAAALELFKDLGFELQNSGPEVGYLARPLRPIPGADIVSVTAEPGYAEAAE